MPKSFRQQCDDRVAIIKAEIRHAQKHLDSLSKEDPSWEDANNKVQELNLELDTELKVISYLS